MKYKDGYIVQSSLDPGGACLQATVPVMQTGEYQVTVPCGGDYTQRRGKRINEAISLLSSPLKCFIRHAKRSEPVRDASTHHICMSVVKRSCYPGDRHRPQVDIAGRIVPSY
jgi:hypothetical protein